MSCYHPNVVIKDGSITPNGKENYRFIGKAKTDIRKEDLESGLATYVPCGQCIGCRLDKSREWADRMLLEYDHTKKAIFLTLTYRDGDIPKRNESVDSAYRNGNLSVRDLQCFIKRLRKHYENKEIRYFASGEYGPTTDRPHYHVIIFGLCIRDFADLRYLGMNELGQPYFTSKTMVEIWKKGDNICLSDVSWKTFAYVARYTLKKQYGKDGKVFYTEENKNPEFMVCSRRPGIGHLYLVDHPNYDFNTVSITMADSDSVYKMPPPKSFQRVFEKIDPVQSDLIKKQRKEFSEDKRLLKMLSTNLSYIEVLKQEENKHYKRILSLQRNIVD